MISLTRPDDYTESEGARFIVKFTKSRGFAGDNAKSFEARLESGESNHEWRTDSLPETNYEAVIRLTHEGQNQKEIAEILKVNKSTVSRYCLKGRGEGKFD